MPDFLQIVKQPGWRAFCFAFCKNTERIRPHCGRLPDFSKILGAKMSADGQRSSLVNVLIVRQCPTDRTSGQRQDDDRSEGQRGENREESRV